MTLIIDVKVSFALISVPGAPHLEQNALDYWVSRGLWSEVTRICSICGEMTMDA
ncbi:hypothetical protein ACLBWT_03210 [Paenibacillus sp. D51F]|uniref:Uncharacterized protein n=1 Tax=Paenibacillus timonensis TaxID=225915 RepID=A0ABW3SC43_9BACL|nr:hypothetical protein [Paenibacillus timonensis]MCH1640902.1 hypothetical protein [Paenibacillus timonensis]